MSDNRRLFQLGVIVGFLVMHSTRAPIAADVHVMISPGFAAAYDQIKPLYEAETGDTLVTTYAPSSGPAPHSIPSRITRGEPADIVIMARIQLSRLAEGHLVSSDQIFDLVRSRIGIAVRAGHPLPDISTVEGLRRTLLTAQSVALSESVSGQYLANELFPQMGIAAEMKEKTIVVSIPVGESIAQGNQEIGFQQMSELLPVKGITVVGRIPDSIQRITVISAGIAAAARNPASARNFVAFATSSKVRSILAAYDLDPLMPN